MKPSSVQLFRFLESKIHPPLPRTARQSQELLAFLTSSFRQHLDKQHPPVQSIETPTSKSTDNKNRSHTPPRATDKHLNSIFDHPLFNTAPSQRSLLQSGNGSKRDGLAGDKHNYRPDPLDVLAYAMASGTADPQVLHRCLKAHRSTMHNLSDGEVHEKMKRSKMGSRVVSWYLSADPKERMLFFGNRHTMALAMPYFVSEGLQATVMEWLRLLRREIATPTRENPIGNNFSEFNLLYEFIAAEVKYERGFDSALKSFIQACRILPSRDESKGPGRYELPPSFRYAAYYLARRISSKDHISDTKQIPAQLFDQFCGISVRLCTSKYHWGALLPLYHPTKPNPNPALEYLKRQSLQSAKHHHARNYDQLIELCLEAAQLCIKQDRLSDASWVMAYAKKLLPTETKEAATESKDREIISLDELSMRLAPTLD